MTTTRPTSTARSLAPVPCSTVCINEIVAIRNDNNPIATKSHDRVVQRERHDHRRRQHGDDGRETLALFGEQD